MVEVERQCSSLVSTTVEEVSSIEEGISTINSSRHDSSRQSVDGLMGWLIDGLVPGITRNERDREINIPTTDDVRWI